MNLGFEPTTTGSPYRGASPTLATTPVPPPPDVVPTPSWRGWLVCVFKGHQVRTASEARFTVHCIAPSPCMDLPYRRITWCDRCGAIWCTDERECSLAFQPARRRPS